MIKICGTTIENFPKGMDESLDNLMQGEIQSQCMHFIKTSVYVYGKDINELLEFANKVKSLDSTYDTIDIYSTKENNEREYIKTKRI